MDLVVRFRAENEGLVPIEDLSIGVALRARDLAERLRASLTADPPVVIDADSFVREDALMPGVPRDFEIEFPPRRRHRPGRLGRVPGQDRAGERLHLARGDPQRGRVPRPRAGAAAVAVVDVRAPAADRGRPRRDVPPPRPSRRRSAPEGRLDAQIRALLGLAADPTMPAVDVAVAPTLLTHLGRSEPRVRRRDGDRDPRGPRRRRPGPRSPRRPSTPCARSPTRRTCS